jgi:hypothetical protein
VSTAAFSGGAHPVFALQIYAQAMRRGDDEKARLRALMEGDTGREMAVIGRRAASAAIYRPAAHVQEAKTGH